MPSKIKLTDNGKKVTKKLRIDKEDINIEFCLFLKGLLGVHTGADQRLQFHGQYLTGSTVNVAMAMAKPMVSAMAQQWRKAI